MTRRYEIIEGTSKKFWEIELHAKGTSFTARWGRIGALGRNEKQHTFADAAAATKAHDKLVAEKEKKGYKLVGGTGKGKPETKLAAPAGPKINAKLEAMLAADPDDVGTWQVYADWLQEAGEPWGEVIAVACAGKKPKKKQDEAAAAILNGLDGSTVTWKHGTIEELALAPEDDPADSDDTGESRDDFPMPRALRRALAHPAGRLVRKLSLGLPPERSGDINWSYDTIIPVIAKAGPLPLLHTVDLSQGAEHMDQDSWRRIGDLRPLWKAAPQLRTLRLMGASGSDGGKPIVLGTITAPHLERFSFESGGLDKSVSMDLGKSTLPALTHLELLFGRDDYGNNHTVKALAGILAGKGFPKLEYLGLKNSEWETELIEAVAKSAILPRLKVVDFSMGTLFRDGAAALVKHAAKFRHLKTLDLDDNYLLPEHVKELKKAIPCASFGTQKEIEDDDEDYRYTTMGE